MIQEIMTTILHLYKRHFRMLSRFYMGTTLFFSFFSVKAQEQFERNSSLQGTLIIAAIHKDGIVVNSDSRCSFVDKGKVQAYFEEGAKLFQVNHIIVGVAGALNFEKITMAGLFKLFSRKYTATTIDLNQLHSLFIDFAKPYLSNQEQSVFRNNDFIICGYSSGKPLILHYRGIAKRAIHDGYLSNYNVIEQNQTLNALLPTMNQAEANKQVKSLMEKTISELNKSDVSLAGGPVTQLYITKEGVFWKEKHVKNTFNSLPEMACALKKGRLKMWFRSTDYENHRKAKLYETITDCK